MSRIASAVILDSATREELERLTRAPSTAQAVARRARVILAASRGMSNKEIAAAFHLTTNTVGTWRWRFLSFGTPGLQNWGHGGRPRKHGPEAQQALRRLLRQPPPDGRERWTLDCLARALRVPRSSVHDMLVAGGFQSRRQPARRRRT